MEAIEIARRYGKDGLKSSAPSPMPKLRSLAFPVRPIDTRTTKLPPKIKAPIYNTPEFQAWRAKVIARAHGRCEARDQNGTRCNNGRPTHRVVADHIIELRDGGQAFDVTNGQCLCDSHHQIKTMQARYRRHSMPIEGG